MSLNWNVSKVQNHETLCFIMQNGERHINPITYAIIWLMIPIGLREITEKNAKMLFRRIHTYEKAFGAMNRKWVDDKPVDAPIEYAQVLEHIGLTTNVTPITEAQFKKQLGERLAQDLYRSANQEIERVEG